MVEIGLPSPENYSRRWVYAFKSDFHFNTTTSQGIRSYLIFYYYIGLIDVEGFSPLFSFRNVSEVLYILLLTRVPAVWSKRA